LKKKTIELIRCEDFFSSLTNFTAKLPEDQQKFVINEKQQLFENWDNLSSLFRTTQKIVNLTFGTTTPNKTISFSSSSFMGILWTIFLLLRGEFLGIESSNLI